MAYIPTKLIQRKAAVEKCGYEPSSSSANLGQNLAETTAPTITTETAKETSEKELTEAERWAYLRSERNKLLAQTDNINSGIPLSFEERGRLYRYRQALRDLPSQEGAPWAPSTIPWPSRSKN